MESFSWAIASMIGGLAVLVAGGDLLVRGSARLAATLSMSPLVIGLTIVAFGTSAPELAVSLQAAYSGTADIALGNVVGSNTFNVLFILGVSTLIVPLVVSSQLVRRDVPVMILASFAVLGFGWNGEISRLEGLLLSIGLVGYTWHCIRSTPLEPPEVAQEFAGHLPNPSGGDRRRAADIGLVAVGLGLLVLGARLLVAGAVEISLGLGVSELIIGLTIVAAGTSMPEVITSIVAAVRGERDIAVGNVVGSSIFNILCVLGLSSLASPNGIRVSPSALSVDIPVMIAAAIACLPIFLSGHRISRLEGLVFLASYAAYTTYLILRAYDSVWETPFRNAVLFVAAPLTALVLAISYWHSSRQSPDSVGGDPASS